MYPWQAAALECGEGGANLVYCAPTSGGKSLVAEVLLLRRLLAAGATTWRHGRTVCCSAVLVPYQVLRSCGGDFMQCTCCCCGAQPLTWCGGAGKQCIGLSHGNEPVHCQLCGRNNRV